MRYQTLITLVIMTLVGTSARSEEQPRVPDLSKAEPQVRAKIEKALDQVRQQPHQAQAWGRYGMLADVHDLQQVADHAYAVAAQLDPGNVRWPYFRGVLAQKNDPAAARDFLQVVIQARPDYAPAHVRLGQAYEAMGLFDQAFRSYARAAALAPNNPTARLHHGLAALTAGNNQLAISELEAARRLQMSARPILLGLARAYRRAGADDDAKTAAEAAAVATADECVFVDPMLHEVEQEAVNLRAYRTRVQALLGAGQNEAAMAQVTAALEHAPNDPLLQAILADVHMQMGHYKQAADAAQRAVDRGVQLKNLPKLIAVASYRAGDLDRANVAAQQAVTMTPDDAQIQQLRAQIAIDRGDRTAAITFLQRAVELRPNDQRTRELLSRLHLQQRQFAKAIEQLNWLVDHGHGTVFTLTQTGLAHLQLKQTTPAIQALKAALKLETGYPEASIVLASVLAAEGQHAEALECLSTSYKTNPRHWSVVNDLAWALATCPQRELRDGARAVRLAEQLVADPKRRTSQRLDTLAAAYAQAERFDEAVRVMNEAIKLTSDEPSRQRYQERRAHYRERHTPD